MSDIATKISEDDLTVGAENNAPKGTASFTGIFARAANQPLFDDAAIHAALKAANDATFEAQDNVIDLDTAEGRAAANATIDPFNDTAESGAPDTSSRRLERLLRSNLTPDTSIGVTGGPLTTKSKQEQEQEDVEAAIDAAIEMFERVDREVKERQEEWDARMHRIGGKDFSGEDLMNIKSFIDKQENQAAFEDDLMQREGLSRDEARQRRTQMQKALDLMSKGRDGTLTSKEKIELEGYKTDAKLGNDLERAQILNQKGVVQSYELSKQATSYGVDLISQKNKIMLEDDITNPSQSVRSSNIKMSVAETMVKSNIDLTSKFQQMAAPQNADMQKPKEPEIISQTRTVQVSEPGWS